MRSAECETPSAAAAVANPSPAIICRGLQKDFGEGETRVRALRGVDLEVPFGEVTLLVGPSGCGKTTLISIIAGLLEPTGGELQVLGTDLPRLSNRRKTAFRRENVGFVFQQFNLLPALTAAENVAVPLLIARESHARAMEKARAMLEAVGIGEKAGALPRELSGGQQQRVAIARALVGGPRLLVCDEPTAALDAHTGHQIMELIRRVALDPQRAVIVVTHDARVFELGDRIVKMDDGRVVGVERGPAGRSV